MLIPFTVRFVIYMVLTRWMSRPAPYVARSALAAPRVRKYKPASHDPALFAEIKDLERRIQKGWDERR